LAFTIREKYQQRMILSLSVRYMHQKEIEYYEKSLPIVDDNQQAEDFIASVDLTEYDL
jgi:hypothetical protein